MKSIYERSQPVETLEGNSQDWLLKKDSMVSYSDAGLLTPMPKGKIDTIATAQEKEPSSSYSIDTISSSKPQKKEAAEKAAGEAVLFSYQTLINMWSWIRSFFVTQEAVAVQATGTTGKAGGDPIGAPVLEPPFQIDQKELAKLIAELRELVAKIKEIMEMTWDDPADKELAVKHLINSYKFSRILREDAAKSYSKDISILHIVEKEIRKKQTDTEELKLQNQRDKEFWGNVSFALNVTAVAIMAASVYASYIMTSAATGGAASLASYKIGMSVAELVTSSSAAVTSFIKSNFEFKFNEKMGEITALRTHREVNTMRIEDAMDNMTSCFEKSLDLVESMRMLAENMREAARAQQAR